MNGDDDIIISGSRDDTKSNKPASVDSIKSDKSKKKKEDEKKSMAEELRYATMKYNNKVKKNKVQLAVSKIKRECMDQASLGKEHMKYYSPFSDDIVSALKNEGLNYRYFQGIYYVEW